MQFLENSRSHSDAYNLISLKKHVPIKWERDWQFYGKYAWYYQLSLESREVWEYGSVHKERTEKWKVK